MRNTSTRNGKRGWRWKKARGLRRSWLRWKPPGELSSETSNRVSFQHSEGGKGQAGKREVAGRASPAGVPSLISVYWTTNIRSVWPTCSAVCRSNSRKIIPIGGKAAIIERTALSLLYLCLFVVWPSSSSSASLLLFGVLGGGVQKEDEGQPRHWAGLRATVFDPPSCGKDIIDIYSDLRCPSYLSLTRHKISELSIL